MLIRIRASDLGAAQAQRDEKATHEVPCLLAKGSLVLFERVRTLTTSREHGRAWVIRNNHLSPQVSITPTPPVKGAETMCNGQLDCGNGGQHDGDTCDH